MDQWLPKSDTRSYTLNPLPSASANLGPALTEKIEKRDLVGNGIMYEGTMAYQWCRGQRDWRAEPGTIPLWKGQAFLVNSVMTTKVLHTVSQMLEWDRFK